MKSNNKREKRERVFGYLAADKYGKEYIFNTYPYRTTSNPNGTPTGIIFSDWDFKGKIETCDLWFDKDKTGFVQLPKGTIRRMIGKRLTWEDEPFELTNWEINSAEGNKKTSSMLYNREHQGQEKEDDKKKSKRGSGLYKRNKEAKCGDMIECPVCHTEFRKRQWQQAFCSGHCKDKFWNQKGDRHNYEPNYDDDYVDDVTGDEMYGVAEYND